METNQSPLSPRDVDAALAEIERTLDQMLVLAQLSASGLNLDRAAPQRRWNACETRPTVLRMILKTKIAEAPNKSPAPVLPGNFWHNAQKSP